MTQKPITFTRRTGPFATIPEEDLLDAVMQADAEPVRAAPKPERPKVRADSVIVDEP